MVYSQYEHRIQIFIGSEVLLVLCVNVVLIQKLMRNELNLKSPQSNRFQLNGNFESNLMIPLKNLEPILQNQEL